MLRQLWVDLDGGFQVHQRRAQDAVPTQMILALHNLDAALVLDEAKADPVATHRDERQVELRHEKRRLERERFDEQASGSIELIEPVVAPATHIAQLGCCRSPL